MRLSRRAYVLLVLVGVSASLSVVVYATVTQIFPAVIVPSLTFSTHQNCSTLNVQHAPAAGAGTKIAHTLSGTLPPAASPLDREGGTTPTVSIPPNTSNRTTSRGIPTATTRAA